jgi:asparagine synthase (glutamine-hydrolysing)
MFARYALTFSRGAHRHGLLDAARSRGFATITDRSGFLLVADDDIPLLEAQDVLVVGQLFSRDGARLTTLGPILASSSTGGISPPALNRHWGNFVLFDASQEQPSLYRDPSGSVPVYHVRHGGEDFFVSDAEFAAGLGLLPDPRVDLTFAIHWLQFPFLRTRRCGLENVAEILPGVRYAKESTGAWIERAEWRPSQFLARRAAIFDPAEASRRLRETALATVAPQVTDRNVHLQLSGGLDSSIIAACLSEKGVEFEGVNFATRSADGDERRYARDVADSCGVTLRELVESGTPSLEAAAVSFRPATNPLLLPFQQAIDEAAREAGAGVLVDGAGGDNLFCYITSAAPILDAIWWSGPRAGLAAASDIATRADCTWWRLASATARRALRQRARWKEDRSLLRRGALLGRAEPHPWLEGLPRALPGKKEHVEALVHIQHFLDRGATGSIRSLHPLLAQPLLELCLQIPSWLWMRGGRDRAIARDAFHDLLPASVFARRSKGSLQGLLHRAFARLAPEMRDLLHSGELRRHRILDEPALNRAFAGASELRDDLQLRITELVALELWMQSWRSFDARRAARP